MGRARKLRGKIGMYQSQIILHLNDFQIFPYKFETDQTFLFQQPPIFFLERVWLRWDVSSKKTGLHVIIGITAAKKLLWPCPIFYAQAELRFYFVLVPIHKSVIGKSGFKAAIQQMCPL